MPSAKSEERIKAEQIYKNSNGAIKLVEIAEQLGIPPAKVRKWKSLDCWDKRASATANSKKKQVERSTSHKGSASLKNVPNKPKKRGAQTGNKNAVGNSGGLGGPVRNKNTEKHGIYSQVFWDVLDEQEGKLIDDIPDDEEHHLIDEIKLLTVRERRLMKKIQELTDSPSGLLVNEVYRSESKREFDKDEKGNRDKELYEERQRKKIEKEEILPGRSVKVGTSTINSSDLLLRAHAELTRVQSQKTRCIETLNKIRQSKKETVGNSVADDWIKGLTGGDI